jgi:hypothetical protein
VAWRQHRLTIAVAVVLMLVIATALVSFRMLLAARLHAAGCGTIAQSACSQSVWERFAGSWSILRDVMLAAPVVLGVFVGAPLFPREFEQRTAVFALTQSVGRLRWWATKITVVGAPLLAGLLGLGFLMDGVATAFPMTDLGALSAVTLQVRAVVPAAFGLLSLAIGVAAGVAIRSVVASLIAGLLVAAVIAIVIAVPLRPHLVPATRNIATVDATPISFYSTNSGLGPSVSTSYFRVDRNALFLDTGYLDAAGAELPRAGQGCVVPVTAEPDAAERTIVTCLHRQGAVTQYTDYLPASMLWPLRGIVTGICVLLAAVALALGAWRLRAAPRSAR